MRKQLSVIVISLTVLLGMSIATYADDIHLPLIYINGTATNATATSVPATVSPEEAIQATVTTTSATPTTLPAAVAPATATTLPTTVAPVTATTLPTTVAPVTATTLPTTVAPATATTLPATATDIPPTATGIPPTATPTDIPPTATGIPPTATPTDIPPTATATATPVSTSTPIADLWFKSWMLNTSNETSSIFDGVSVNVSSSYTKTLNGKDYQCITASGIPNYETIATQSLIDSLNSRPLASRDFGTGATTITVGQSVPFGANIGYSPAQGCTSSEDGYGYWPPGPSCPTAQAKEQCFPLEPAPSTEVCETGLNDMGTWVNGVAIFNWQDGQSYNGAGVWDNEAFHFEFYDLDICPGHSANGNYHHHTHPVCLADQLGDTGNGHSPLYGFAADGYPLYGPWHDSGVLAQSCWKTRDYDDPASATGCGVAGERSCLLVDQYDISQGTVAAASSGPSTSDIVSSMSSNQFTTTSGYYFQDYYYDATCTAQGIQYLDEHNGHDHDDLGYHYHNTRAVDGSGYTDVFPFYIGPTYAGTLQDEAIATCSTDDGGGPPGGGPPGGGPPGGGPPGPQAF